VAGWIQRHCESAEGPDGILRLVEAVAGHSRDVTLAHDDHERLLQRADALLAVLDDHEASLSHSEARRLGTELTALFRQHEGRVADLIYSTLDTYPGVGD
jgi:hypothetical protein